MAARQRPRDTKDFIEMIKQEGAKFIDLKFADPFGRLQHTTIPAHRITPEVVEEEGIGFDGSSIRMWQSIHESDMLLFIDPKTAVVDPFYKEKTISVMVNIRDPITREPYYKDTRYIAQRAEQYLKETGIGDSTLFGPELEFFVFDSVSFGEAANYSFFKFESEEGPWRAQEEGSKGYKIKHKEGYFPTAPFDTYMDFRNEVSLILEEMGIEIEVHHHEVATAGQGEIDFKARSLTESADNALLVKYVLKNVARKYGKTATYMPKPIFGDNGSGMHTHQSIWKNGKPLFAGEKYAGLSELAMHYIGGVLKHARSICAFSNPTVNSYKRLVPGFEAPINLAYSQRNRSASIRIPMYSTSPKAKRIEVRFPDPSCNPYLAFAAMLMAGIDGIEKKINPGEPLDTDIYKLPPEILAKVPKTPGNLGEALDELKKNHDFLTKGGVFSKKFIEEYIEWKYEKEVKEYISRITPWEYINYFDV
ncbi:MAG: type I glutamate--ammonia ligase [Candidatus Calescibacterium sp.]|nr:type I glutamate--ammonia ligase [Candidatus Calescibacterium sp.]MDW8088114.1 type I glutamate--ammonia ligase [Candidatus Calescibacterium sp.]